MSEIRPQFGQAMMLTRQTTSLATIPPKSTGVNIIAREGWRARTPQLWPVQLDPPVNNVYCCFSGTSVCTTSRKCGQQIKKLQKFHIYQKRMRDIQYNFLVGCDGNVYEGRGWDHAATVHKESSVNQKSVLIALIGIFKVLSLKAPRLVSREEWGARRPKQTFPLSHPVEHVVRTFTRTEPCFTTISCKHFIKRFQKYQQSVRKKLDIPYNFLVGYDGTQYEGRGWNIHTEVKYYLPKDNSVREAIHIAFIGDFNDDSNRAPEAMYISMRNIIEYGISKNYISEKFKLHMV